MRKLRMPKRKSAPCRACLVGAIMLAAAFWVCSGLLASGIQIAYHRSEYARLYQSPKHAGRFGSWIALGIVGGPLFLIASSLVHGWRHGVSFDMKPFPCTEKEDYAVIIWCKT